MGKLSIGINDLETYCKNNGIEHLLLEWDVEKNHPLNYSNIAYGSKTKVWWKCSKNHEWETSVCERTRGRGCPYCSGRRIKAGYNDLCTTFPELLKEWDYELNIQLGLFPEKLTSGCNRKAGWKCCSCGYRWMATINSRTDGIGCPQCSKKRQAETNIQNKITNGSAIISDYPELLEEWDFPTNDIKGLLPNKVLSGSKKSVAWVCSKCHYGWTATAYSRTAQKTGCPSCAGNVCHEGVNDLATLCPELLKEWDYDANSKINLFPNKTTSKNDKKANWICSKCGNRWSAVISSRTSGIGCPKCSSVRHVSLAETIIFYYINQMFDDAVANYKLDRYRGKEFDIFIPSIKVAIEYDGQRYHKNKQRDLEKNTIAKNIGVFLIRLREPLCEKMISDANTEIIILDKPKSNYLYLEGALHKLIDLLLSRNSMITRPEINIEKDLNTIIDLYNLGYKEKSLRSENNTISSEWNYLRNGLLTPDNVSVSSSLRVWWKCSLGHEWKSRIADRTKGHGCPFCSDRKVLKGFNDICTLFPSIIEHWDFDKNHMDPHLLGKGSHIKAWWKCSNNHSFDSQICSVIKKKEFSCPICSNQRVLAGFNDLQTTNPSLLVDWNYDKNKKLNLEPTMFTQGSNQRVWWKCKNGHEWELDIKSKSRGIGCPYCSGLKVIAGVNDIKTTNSEVMSFWDYEKNSNVSPDTVSAGSSKKIHWKCPVCLYEWKSSVYEKTSSKGCPECFRKRRVKAVKCIEKNIEYISITEASKQTGISVDSISHCLRGNHKTAGGYHWEYVN